MTTETAFNTLNLPQSSTINEVIKQHRKLIKEIHPDTNSVSSNKAAELNNARDIAFDYLGKRTTSLTVIKQVAELIHVSNEVSIKKQEYKIQVDAIIQSVVKRYINRHKQRQQFLKFIGYLFALLVLINTNLVPSISKFFGANFNYSIVFGSLIVLIGCVSFALNTLIDKTQFLIEDFKETLDDNGSYFEILRHIKLSNKSLDNLFTKKDLQQSIQAWARIGVIGSDNIDTDTLFEVYRAIGLSDFTKLILVKGLEKQIIKEIEIDSNTIPLIVYKFNVPSDTKS